MSRKKYLEKREKLATIDIDCSGVQNLIAELQGIVEDFEPKGYYDLYIESDTEHGYYDEVYTNHYIYGTRKETEQERERRLKVNREAREKRKVQKKQKVEEDRKLFEALKEKYGW